MPQEAMFFNEVDALRSHPSHFQAMHRWLETNSHFKLMTLNQQALSAFHRKGVTFTVYSDAKNTERVIPFDIIPRIITQQDWEILESGCTQRIKALNAFIHDIYHQQNIIAAGIIPAEQILVNDCFEPWMVDIDLPQPIYTHVSGIDLVRNEDGQFYVLEDNLRTPSGISYLLESRQISEHLLPELFEEFDIAPVHHYPSMLLQSLIECSGKPNPKWWS
ncbi:circularly permuted type 2 ATP-grasp protein [Vitreoscilla massiliensis]|uniref:circularly permuted type 2 ATP-grasp protein n=1 Tax=Vitreoscilla massiliensis TaxID=1689272 RepID=UPI000A72A0E2|nr:circularly permuted type 2 ATP-grasp protein [Vitreoscilla massiliensis]